VNDEKETQELMATRMVEILVLSMQIVMGKVIGFTLLKNLKMLLCRVILNI
jgi:hypothetical protein